MTTRFPTPATLKSQIAARATAQAAFALALDYDAVAKLATDCIKAIQDGAKIIWFGNGGSAAIAAHLAAELVGRFQKERRSIASIALGQNAAITTAVANDYGYDMTFLREFGALFSQGDVAIGMSTSGKSANVRRVLDLCASFDAPGWLLCGAEADYEGPTIHCPGSSVAIIQEQHLTIGHMICEAIDDNVVG